MCRLQLGVQLRWTYRLCFAKPNIIQKKLRGNAVRALLFLWKRRAVPFLKTKMVPAIPDVHQDFLKSTIFPYIFSIILRGCTIINTLYNVLIQVTNIYIIGEKCWKNGTEALFLVLVRFFWYRFCFQKWYREILQALLISRFILYHCLLPDALPSGQSIAYLPLPYNFSFQNIKIKRSRTRICSA